MEPSQTGPDTAAELAGSEQLAEIRRIIQEKLVGFTNEFPANLSVWDMESFTPDATIFPVPDLVLLALRNVMGFKSSGHGEKIRWSVYACFLGEPVAFSLRKLGFSILKQKDSQVDLKRLIGQLTAALKVLEASLGEVVEDQIKAGRISMDNRATEFEARYRFFRDLASQAYAKADKLVQDIDALDMVTALNHRISLEREGFFHSTAMIDAFFSSLEHNLNLLRAFTGKPLDIGELKLFLWSKWDEKFKVIVGLPLPRNAELLLGKMRKIKERIRNPFAHGGTENDGGSLYVHVPSIGAIPANLLSFRESVRFNFIPIELEDHDEVCATFDELENFLRTGPLSGAYRLLDAGLDPSFDSISLNEYAEAIRGGRQVLNMYIEGWCRAWEQHQNMEY